MATLVTLLDVETEIESVLKTFLTSSPYSLGAIASDSATELTTPRVESSAEVVKWGPHQITISSGAYAGMAIYDQFQVRVKLNVVYQPEHSQGQGSIRGTLRKALSNWTGFKAAFATNNYLLPASDSLRQTDGNRTIDNDEKTETISATLEFVVFLNPNALTAAT